LWTTVIAVPWSYTGCKGFLNSVEKYMLDEVNVVQHVLRMC
jgi:hypothetical protein